MSAIQHSSSALQNKLIWYSLISVIQSYAVFFDQFKQLAHLINLGLSATVGLKVEHQPARMEVNVVAAARSVESKAKAYCQSTHIFKRTLREPARIFS